MSRDAVALTLLSFFSALGLAAQGPWPVDPGSRVRVQTDSGAWIGTFVSQDASSLRLRWSGQRDSMLVTVPQSRIQGLEVSAGKYSNVGKGAGIGFGVGAVVGLVAGLACSSSSSGFVSQCTGGQVAGATIELGFIGAALGGLVGAASQSEHWKQVKSTTAHVSLTPHGVGLSVSIGF
jgi:hypothetical protein